MRLPKFGTPYPRFQLTALLLVFETLISDDGPLKKAKKLAEELSNCLNSVDCGFVV